MDYLIKTSNSKEEKIFLLNNFVEMVRGTVFRQAMFAEFENAVHDKVNKDEALIPDEMTKIYKSINEKYYGADKGLYKMDDLYAHEWSYIPHFYYDYYVFQYAVGFMGALTLATKVLEEKIKPEHYVDNFLKQGSAKPPLQILKEAGVDMTTEEPYKLTERVFKERLGQLRDLLNQK